MLFIKTDGDHLDRLPEEQQQVHIQKVGAYIGKLMGGRTLLNKSGALIDGPFTETKEVLAGYFHVVAKDLDEAVAIAKANPIFEDVTASFEIRAIKSVIRIN